MVDKDNTVTVAMLLSMLADGRVSPDMPIAIWDNMDASVRGVSAVEIHTYKDGSKVLSFFSGAPVADIKNSVSAAEVFPR